MLKLTDMTIATTIDTQTMVIAMPTTTLPLLTNIMISMPMMMAVVVDGC